MVSNKGNNHVVEEIMVEILSKLPVKSLMRFKCVCKYWNNITRNASFITKQFHNQNEARLLVRHYCYINAKYSFALFPDETLACAPPVYHNVEDLQMPNQPGVIGPVNGIFGFWNWDRIALWNPATRDFRPLPIPQPDFPPDFRSYSYCFGFGLDRLTNDYKIVWLRYYWDEKNDDPYQPTVISVYSLSTNSWRLFEVDLSRTGLQDSLCNTHINGVYYWLASNKDDRYTVVSFNLSDEVFREQREIPDIPKSQWGDLTVYNDTLAVFIYDPNEVEKTFDIWAMREDEDWIKVLSMQPLLDIERPLAFWKNGDIFLETCTSELILYNPHTQEVKEFRPRGKGSCLRIFMYKESLASVKGGSECQEGDSSLDMVTVHDFFTYKPHLIEGVPSR